ncbi:MAG: PAS domain S-box protein [Proteobacteria bacterium]|nr:PAS domain S-box protein [Pseudomonadota bacterium]
MSERKRPTIRVPIVQWLILGAALVMLGGFIGWNIYSDRDATDAREREQLSNHAKVIDENLGQQLRTTNRILDSIRSDFTFLSTKTEDKASASRRLQLIVDAMQGVRTMLVFDAEGNLSASNRGELVGRNFRERNYFQVARRTCDPTVLYVTPPYKNVNGVYTMTLTKAVRDARGECAGAVAATFAPEFFSTLLNSILYAPDMRASLLHGDGDIFLNVPFLPEADGMNVAKPGTFFTRHRLGGQRSSLFTGMVYATGGERMIAQRTVQILDLQMDNPFVVATSRDLSQIFANWRRIAYLQGGLFLLLVLITTLGLHIYQKRQWAYDRAVAEDEDRRKQAEAELQESEARFRSLTKMSSDFYWESDAEHRLTVRTESKREAAEGVFQQISPIGKRRWESPHLSPDESGWQKHRAVLDAHLPFRDFEIARPRANGSVHHVSISGEPVFDASGGFKGYRGVGADITERRQAEDMLRESESSLREAQEVGRVGSYVFDIPADVWTSSAMLDTIFGIRADINHDLAGWMQIVHPDEREQMGAYFQRIVAEHTPFEKEYRIVRASDGVERWVLGLTSCQRQQGRTAQPRWPVETTRSPTIRVVVADWIADHRNWRR